MGMWHVTIGRTGHEKAIEVDYPLKVAASMTFLRFEFFSAYSFLMAMLRKATGSL